MSPSPSTAVPSVTTATVLRDPRVARQLGSAAMARRPGRRPACRPATGPPRRAAATWADLDLAAVVERRRPGRHRTGPRCGSDACTTSRHSRVRGPVTFGGPGPGRVKAVLPGVASARVGHHDRHHASAATAPRARESTPCGGVVALTHQPAGASRPSDPLHGQACRGATTTASRPAATGATVPHQKPVSVAERGCIDPPYAREPPKCGPTGPPSPEGLGRE